jgi:hypothetical protein
MPEYREGPEAKENFDRAMKSLFQSPKKAPKKRRAKPEVSIFRKKPKSDTFP